MPSPDDLSFAKLAVEMKYVTTAQVEEAFEAQRKMAVLGVFPKSLAEILMDRGVLSQYLVQTIYKAQGAREGFPQIPGYSIEAKIGHGGMGTVYRARQIHLDRAVAIKVLDPELAKDRNFIARFLREAKAVALLNHENVIVGIDAGRTARDEYYFVMEHVEGPTVYDLLKKDRYFEERRALSIALQIGRALQHAADHNLVHRDIKPDNIMITTDAVAKLCDLGLAKSTRGNLRLTQAGATHGTPHYMSPEQARGREDVDIRSDIYSLGATLYHMLVGDVPFDGESAAVILLKHISEDVPSPRVRRPEISENTCHVLERMMAKRREDRYQRPAELVEDLERLLGGEAPKSRRLTPGASSVMRIPSDLIADPPGTEALRDEATEAMSRSRLTGPGYIKATVALAAGVLLLAVFAGAVAALRSPPETARSRTPAPPDPRDPNGKGRLSDDSEESLARDYYNYALAYEADHPDGFKDLLERYTVLRKKYPSTLYGLKADEKILEHLKKVEDLCATAFEATARAVRDHVKEGRFDTARRVLETERKRFEFLEDQNLGRRVPSWAQFVALSAEVESEAESWARRKIEKAEGLEKEGDPSGAIRELEGVVACGIPALADAARAGIRRLEEGLVQAEEVARRDGEKRARQGLNDVLGRAVALLEQRDYPAAQALLADALTRPLLEPHEEALRRAVVLTEDARGTFDAALARIEALASTDSAVVLELKSGEKVNGYVGRLRPDGTLPVFHSASREVEKTAVPFSEISSREVLDLAGLGYKGRPLEPAQRLRRGSYLLADGDLEGVAQEYTRAAEGGVKVDWRGFEEFRAARSEAEAGRLWMAALKAREAGSFEEVLDLLERIASDFHRTLFYETHRERIEEERDGAQTLLARRKDVRSLLRGKVEDLGGGRVRVAYEFGDVFRSLTDFELVGPRDPDREWTAVPEGILGAGREGLRWRPRFLDALDVTLDLEAAEPGPFADFLRLESDDGHWVFRLGLSGTNHAVLLERAVPGGATTSTPLARGSLGEIPQGATIRVRVQAGPSGVLFFAGETRVLSLSEGPRGPLRASFWGTPTSLVFSTVLLECQLDPAWILGR